MKNVDIDVHRYARIVVNLDKGEEKVKRFMECNEKLLDFLEEDGKETQLNAARLFYKTNRLKLDAARGALDAKAKREEKGGEITAPRVEPSGTSPMLRKQHIKVKPMDPPTWDGKYRSFSRFKKLWDENIPSKVEDGAQHLLL